MGSDIKLSGLCLGPLISFHVAPMKDDAEQLPDVLFDWQAGKPGNL